jgi:hypothetical protein
MEAQLAINRTTSDNSIATALQQHCNSIATALQQHCNSIATAL